MGCIFWIFLCFYSLFGLDYRWCWFDVIETRFGHQWFFHLFDSLKNCLLFIFHVFIRKIKTRSSFRFVRLKKLAIIHLISWSKYAWCHFSLESLFFEYPFRNRTLHIIIALFIISIFSCVTKRLLICIFSSERRPGIIFFVFSSSRCIIFLPDFFQPDARVGAFHIFRFNYNVKNYILSW